VVEAADVVVTMKCDDAPPRRTRRAHPRTTGGAATGTGPLPTSIERQLVSDKPSVLFVCVHNAGRSQMAAGWLRHLAGDAVEVRSAGSIPGDQVNPSAVTAMAEVGIDISAQRPKLLTTDAVEVSDVVITMGCGDACPIFPGKRYLDWELEDPAGKGVEAVRPIRDDIEKRVRGLVDELVPAR
jgi:arsenate reductase